MSKGKVHHFKSRKQLIEQDIRIAVRGRLAEQSINGLNTITEALKNREVHGFTQAQVDGLLDACTSIDMMLRVIANKDAEEEKNAKD